MCQGRWSSTVDDLTLPQLSNLQLVTVPVLVWLLPVPFLEGIWRGVHCWLPQSWKSQYSHRELRCTLGRRGGHLKELKQPQTCPV